MTEENTTNWQTERDKGTVAENGASMSTMGELFDPFKGEPYAEWAKARKEEPVFYASKIDHYVVTRDEDVRHVMMNTEAFSASNVLELITAPSPAAGQILMEAGVKLSPSVVDEDPPTHAKHRKAMRLAGLNPAYIRSLEPLVRQNVAKRIDAFVKDGEADTVGDFIFEIAARVLFKMMGVPENEIHQVNQFVKREAVLGWGVPTEEEQIELATAIAQYWEYSKGHVDRLLQNPGDDYISRFIEVLRENDLYERDFVNVIMLQLLFAGHETTTNATGSMYKTLLSHRDQWEELCENPGLIPNAVEESLRFAGSVPQWRRRTKEDVELGGVKIPANSQLLVALGSANRDEARFRNGDEFDIHREDAKKHVGFGHGPHLCLGAPLARQEMRIALEETLKRLPHMRLVEGQEFQYSPNTTHRGPEHVLVEWAPSENPIPDDRP